MTFPKGGFTTSEIFKDVSKRLSSFFGFHHLPPLTNLG